MTAPNLYCFYFNLFNFIKVTEKLNELEEHKSKCRKAVDRLAEVNKQFQLFKNDANEKIKEKETRLIELTNIAEGLENENSVV